MLKDTKSNGPDVENDGLAWKNFKQFQHRYLVNVPNCLEDVRSYAEVLKYFHLPYPITNPVQVEDFDAYRDFFKVKPKPDSEMDYYRKLYLKEEILKRDLKKKKIIEVPQYVLDIIKNTEESRSFNIANYTGGVLDTFYLHGNDYIVNSSLCKAPQINRLDDCAITVNLNVEKNVPVYCIKTSTCQDYALISMRHKFNTSVIQIRSGMDGLQQDLLCRTTSTEPYGDMNFNPTQNKQYAIVTNTGNLKILDLEKNQIRDKYTFTIDEHISPSDSLARIEYIDTNTICFMNRLGIYLLDLRSFQTQKLCLKESWLECDDLCCIAKNIKYANGLYITSKHKLMHIDVRLLKEDNHIMHMLSTMPFIVSAQENGFEENICLCGTDIKDKVIIWDNGTLSIPSYIPNTIDALTKACLTHKFAFYEEFEHRLCFPVLGMKLHKDAKTDDTVLYTSTALGDLFKQKLGNSSSGDVNATKKLVTWIKTVHRRTPKVLHATSISNLNNLMYVITNNFPNGRNLKRLKGTDISQKFKTRFGDMSKYLQSSVGESINAIWDEPVVATADAKLSTSAKNKVTDWLSLVE